MVALPTAVADCLADLGYRALSAEALSGGVGSDIWRVETPQGPVCVKRALPRLKVAQLWEAPVERNAFEVAWLRAARRYAPQAVPEVLAHDPGAGLFIMPWFDPSEYRAWKAHLKQGRADPGTAAAVASNLAAIHAGTAGDPEVAGHFATDEIFLAIRPDPYLRTTAARHPDLAKRLEALLETTMQTKHALVHGDVSPKNILVGPAGPLFIDAECAWYGDPAFDLAFCLNHLLLKCLWTPRARQDFLLCFDVLSEQYLTQVSWESPDALEARAAALLPGLFLARVDGKSPVEYLTNEGQKQRVRRVARPMIARPPRRLAELRRAWAKECA